MKLPPTATKASRMATLSEGVEAGGPPLGDGEGAERRREAPPRQRQLTGRPQVDERGWMEERSGDG